jgi:flavodoxin I
MKALVIYDSVFGNTEKIARAIGADPVQVLPVGSVQPGQLAGLDLLIVGSPTRGFRATPAIQAFLKSIPPGSLKGVRVAAFDTRILLSDVNSAILNVMVRIFGYAAKPIADRLKEKGGELAAPPEGFLVAASEGPLKAGELERAAAWGTQICRA